MKWVKTCRVCGQKYDYEDESSSVSFERCCSLKCLEIYYIKFRCGSVPRTLKHLKKIDKFSDFTGTTTRQGLKKYELMINITK